MKITRATFAGSSTRVDQQPSKRLPEFAFIGRSNVGKSSLINSLTGVRGLAKTSSTPGKTKLVNHFLINDSWYLVDLPGYGFARMPQKDREELRKIIYDYLDNSTGLVLLFVLIDSRHDIQQNDFDFINSLGEAGVPFALVYTKCDKLGSGALKAQMDRNAAMLSSRWEELPPVFTTSSLNGKGREELISYIGIVLNSLKAKSN
ncbi:MAG: YihA family ribosome biogenesis GTP-binding protein [Bacteroidales bacterium]|nr:YihA family ribosome biogenesis GTP-binding protein [Bacteroidales bacterium]